jgi:hypothetical protein
MKPQATLRRALTDRNLLGGVLSGDSWRTWRVLLIAAMGEPLTEDERMLFAELTGRSQEPLQRVEEFVGVIGRRGGKSRAIATLAVYIAALCSHTDTLVPGETGLVLIIAPDQRQALIVLEYIAAALAATPILAQLVASRTADTLTLTTGISIEVRSASFRRACRAAAMNYGSATVELPCHAPKVVRARETRSSSSSVARKRQFLVTPLLRPVRPMRCRNDADARWRANQDNAVEVADVESKLEGRGSDDDAVRLLCKSAFSLPSFVER